MLAVFANPYASRSQHISSQKIAQLRYKSFTFEPAIPAEQSCLGISGDALIFVGVQLGEVMPADAL